jgi:polysaccharide pyruvyl transferase WcaK-like protein
MTPKIFMGHDFFGAGNFGDDLMLDGFLCRLVESGKQAEVVGCIPHDIDSQRRRFPAIGWLSAADAQRREEQLRQADVWLGLGGTPFQLESGPWSLDHLDRERELCNRLGKPMLFLGVGCDSPDAAWDPRGRRVIEASERIWTRDARSADVIGGVAAAGIVAQGADLAHIALGAAVRPVPEPAVLGLLLGLQGPGIVDIIAVEQEIARRFPTRTRWLVQEMRSFPCTERWNYAGLSERTQGSVQLMPMEYATDTLEEFLANFGAPETVVSSRYHGALIAAWHACCLGVIARTDKLDGIVADLDVPYVRRINNADELEALAREAVPVEPARLEVLRDRANAMCDAFFAWLGAPDATSHPDAPRTPRSS